MPRGNPLFQSELDLDWTVRRLVACPVCHVVPPQRCGYGKSAGASVNMSHTGRYDVAAAAGLVPPIPPSPGRDRPVDLQPIPHAVWTPIRGYEDVAEVYQETGTVQSLTATDGVIRWANLANMPMPCSILLRPPGGVYPHGWHPPLATERAPRMWWVSEAHREDAA